MKIRAKVGFCGILTMAQGEIRECSNEMALSDLLQAGYVEEIKEQGQRKPETKGTRKGKRTDEGK